MRICWFTTGRDKDRENRRTGRIEGDTYVYKKKNCDIDSVIKLSEKMRKEVRGQVVGSLG
jgi:predicted HAD superfamily phosphohydrolase